MEITPELISPYSSEYQAWLLKEVTENIARGIIEEPRVFFDNILIGAAPVETVSGSDIFKNGEKFPIRLTHMLLGVNEVPSSLPGTWDQDERFIQDIGVCLRFHNQYYQNPDFVPAPLWQNIVATATPLVAESTACWKFIRPVVLSARDTLQVSIGCINAPSSPVPVNVTFTGVGVSSKRPYLFNGQFALSGTVMQIIPTANFRNDGAEPVLLTDMTVNVAGNLDSDDPEGDIRSIRVQVKQVGNGTSANWMVGPVNPPVLGVNAQYLGVYSGRVIVHRFPGGGLLWEPGEGIDVLAKRFVGTNNVSLGIALAGYIAVG